MVDLPQIKTGITMKPTRNPTPTNGSKSATTTTKKPLASKRTERTFALRSQLVYQNPHRWDKDIATGTGDTWE
jgi:hypothetical protein